MPTLRASPLHASGLPQSSHLPNGDNENQAMSVKRDLFSSSCRNVLNIPRRSVLDAREQEAKRPLSLESLSDGGAKKSRDFSSRRQGAGALTRRQGLVSCRQLPTEARTDPRGLSAIQSRTFCLGTVEQRESGKPCGRGLSGLSSDFSMSPQL